MKRDKDKFYGCFVGLAVGDALGAPLEFTRPGSFEPITDMIEGGKLLIKKGEFTDDTSMALCLADSLIRSNGFDPRGQGQLLRMDIALTFQQPGLCLWIRSDIHDDVSQIPQNRRSFCRKCQSKTSWEWMYHETCAHSAVLFFE